VKVILLFKTAIWLWLAIFIVTLEVPPVFDEAASWLIRLCMVVIAVMALTFGLEELENGI
jgi:uncharacterized membrane-anchored protein